MGKKRVKSTRRDLLKSIDRKLKEGLYEEVIIKQRTKEQCTD